MEVMLENVQKTSEKGFYKRLALLVIPMALQSLITSSLMLLDNLMVSKLGELSLTATGLATQLFSIQFMLLFGFCSGSATFYTQFWGVKDIKNIKKVMGLALVSCLSLSLIFFLVSFFFPINVLLVFTDDMEAAVLGADYLKYAAINFVLLGITMPFSAALRSTKQTLAPMLISVASFFTDVIFNYLLIFGKFGFPMLGVKGAAIATMLARILEVVLTIYTIWGRKNILSGSLKELFSFDWTFAKRVYKNAWVTTANETLWSSAVALQNAAFGRMGITEFAAIQASRTVMDLFQTACFCIGDASLILIGEQLGQNNIEEARKISEKLIKASLTLGAITGTLLILFNKPILALFTLTDLGVVYAKSLMIVRAITLPMNLINALLIAGIFRAGGDARYAAITEISVMWIYSVPAAFFFALYLKLPVAWVMLLVQCEGVIKLIILLKRYFSGKWLRNMISGM